MTKQEIIQKIEAYQTREQELRRRLEETNNPAERAP
jgi:hypothetical protein